MISKFRFFLVIFFLLSFLAKGQGRTKLIGLETGVAFFGSEYSSKDYIRADMAPLYDFAWNQNIRGEMHKIFVGAKMEVRTANDKFGVLTGIRFTQFYSSITQNTAPGYFYFRFQQTGTTTEYLKIKQLNQTSGYLGIPVEVRYFPFRVMKVRVYFTIGGELSYRITTKTRAVFYDPAMGSNQDGVENIVGAPNRLSSAIYSGGGFMLGNEGKPRISIGLTAPILTNNNSSLIAPVVGAGFQLQIQIPLK